jgi:hypothetical protein
MAYRSLKRRDVKRRTRQLSIRRVENLTLKRLLETFGERLRSEFSEAQEPVPSKLMALLDKLETAEANGNAVLLDEELLKSPWQKDTVH